MSKNSLIEILKSKSIYKVSIQELCEKSEINRSTFYKYYGSQFDLLAEMESDVLTLVMESLSHHSRQDTRSLSEISFLNVWRLSNHTNLD